MALPRVLILGAGFGGLAAATTLRRAAGDRVDLLVVDAVPAFMMGLRKLWLLDGRGTRAEGTRDRRTLPARAIPCRQGKVAAIDLAGRWVAVDGDRLLYDYLIVALGAEPRLDLIPGGVAGAYNLYSPDEAEALGRRLSDFDRGRILIAIAGLPYKCPPAPYEAAFIIEAMLRRAGRRSSVEIEVITPQPMSLPVAGPGGGAGGRDGGRAADPLPVEDAGPTGRSDARADGRRQRGDGRSGDRRPAAPSARGGQGERAHRRRRMGASRPGDPGHSGGARPRHRRRHRDSSLQRPDAAQGRRLRGASG